MRESERSRECVCVCVRERDRERGWVGGCVRVYMYTSARACGHAL